MPQTDLIFEMLKADLSAPRVLLAQVEQAIQQHYGDTHPDLQAFFVERYPQLEDYEVDLLFSPQYTPAEHHRLEYIPLLGSKHLHPSDVALLKQRLIQTGLQVAFRTEDGQTEVVIPVHEVCIDRYVNLLRLEQKLPEAVYAEILASVPEASHHEVNLLAREDCWQSEARQKILIAFLRVFHRTHDFSTLKVSFLTNFVHTYRPAHLFELARQFDSLIQSCQTDMENVAGRGFHDEYLKALNVGNGLTQGHERDVWAHYRHMIQLATQLRADFEQINEVCPDIVAEVRAQLPV